MAPGHRRFAFAFSFFISSKCITYIWLYRSAKSLAALHKSANDCFSATSLGRERAKNVIISLLFSSEPRHSPVINAINDLISLRSIRN